MHLTTRFYFRFNRALLNLANSLRRSVLRVMVRLGSLMVSASVISSSVLSLIAFINGLKSNSGCFALRPRDRLRLGKIRIT